MSGCVTSPVTNSLLSFSERKPRHLLVWGLLESICPAAAADDVEDIGIIARVGGQDIELPTKMGDTLQPLLGQNISLARINGHWTGERHSP
jgi:hypothetical protein